jgi:hypothetical protein
MLRIKIVYFPRYSDVLNPLQALRTGTSGTVFARQERQGPRTPFFSIMHNSVYFAA